MGKRQSKEKKASASVMGLGYSKKSDPQPPASHVTSSNDFTNSCSDVDTGLSVASSGDATYSLEVVACRVGELSDGDTKEVKVGESTILLVRDKGDYYAVGNKCTHYGAPLSKGVLCGGKVRCPWHGACFNVKTGDIEDFPGLDSLPVFQVEVRDDEVVVKVTDPEALKKGKRVKVMSRADPANDKTFVLVGGGPASVTCAETLRQEGFTGRVVVLTSQLSLPYDRPKLSKAMTTTAEAIALRNEDFYRSYGIEFFTSTEVAGVDTAQRQVKTSTGDIFPYDALLLATGGRPRRLSTPGADLNNVCVLRTPDDANRIAASGEGMKVVILGASFIGLEVAAYLHNRAESVTVVGTSKMALQNVFGPQIGACITKLHEDKGVKFCFGNSIQQFDGEGGTLTQVTLTDGTVLQADLCVLGVGVEPATDFLRDSGVGLTDRGFVTVDKYMKTEVDGVYAAGDIVQFPLFLNQDQPSNVQHWQMAHQHGRIAALNMLGRQQAVHSVPYFWTVMYGKSVRYTGYGAGYDDVVVHGDLSVPQFAAFYTRGDKVVAVASLAFDPIVSQAASFMEQGETILKSDILQDPRGWLERLKRVDA